MAWAALIVGGGSALIGAGVNYFQGRQQMNRAQEMNVSDPGYQGNPALQANADMLRNRFTNYTLPNYSTALDNINRASEMGYRSAQQGAVTSSDILDAATRIAYGNQNATLNLDMAQAQGQENAMMQYLTANQMAGQEVVNANDWARQQYLRDRQDQANQYNSGLANTNNAIQSGINTAGQFAGYAAMRGSNNALDQRITNVRPGAQISYNPQIERMSSSYIEPAPNPYIPVNTMIR